VKPPDNVEDTMELSSTISCCLFKHQKYATRINNLAKKEILENPIFYNQFSTYPEWLLTSLAISYALHVNLYIFTSAFLPDVPFLVHTCNLSSFASEFVCFGVLGPKTFFPLETRSPVVSAIVKPEEFVVIDKEESKLAKSTTVWHDTAEGHVVVEESEDDDNNDDNDDDDDNDDNNDDNNDDDNDDKQPERPAKRPKYS